MKSILLIYATREGHTRKVISHIGEVLGDRGQSVEVHNARDLPDDFDVARYAAAILAASVHLGKHEREMVRFVTRHREALAKRPTAFLSVSMAEAGAEDTNAPAERRAEAAKQVAKTMDAFFDATGWHPDRARPVAGALMYRKYNLLVRWVMKRIARSAGASTDTSRNHVFTDWDALDKFADNFIAALADPAA